MAKKNYITFGVVFALSLAADQLTKMWARSSLKPLCRFLEPLPQGCAPKTVIPGFWDFRYSENPGAAFGLFRDLTYGRYLLFAFGLVALCVIGWYLYKLRPGKARIAAELGLLAGGAIGNIVDRVMFGRVTDFVVWKAGSYEWPTFNVADAALVVGVLALLLDARGEDLMEPASSSSAANAAADEKPQKA